MFNQTKNVLDKFENIINKDSHLEKEETQWLENIELYLAIAIRNELPFCSYTLGKILCDMNEEK